MDATGSKKGGLKQLECRARRAAIPVTAFHERPTEPFACLQRSSFASSHIRVCRVFQLLPSAPVTWPRAPCKSTGHQSRPREANCRKITAEPVRVDCISSTGPLQLQRHQLLPKTKVFRDQYRLRPENCRSGPSQQA